MQTIKTTKNLSGSLDRKNVDIKEAYFSFTRNNAGVFVGMIALGPDYTDGTLTKADFNNKPKCEDEKTHCDSSQAVFDSNNEYKLTRVSPNTTYILSCTNTEDEKDD